MFNTQPMHHIQKTILGNLARSSPLRFTQLQPSHVPNNTFSYHLKKLLETGYIASTIDGYIVTRKALKTLSYSDPNEKRMSHPLSLTMVYVTNSKNEVLLLKRNKQPFKDLFGLPAGLIHSNESVESAARRELYEKTSILAGVGTLRARGVLDFRYQQRESNDTFFHGLGFIYTYKCTDDTFTDDINDQRQLVWSKLDHFDILPEVFEIAEIIHQNKFDISSVDFEEPV